MDGEFYLYGFSFRMIQKLDGEFLGAAVSSFKRSETKYVAQGLVKDRQKGGKSEE